MRTDLWLTRRGVGEAIIPRMDKQSPAVEQGNNIQYPQINHSGKEYEKEFAFHNSLSIDSHSHAREMTVG